MLVRDIPVIPPDNSDETVATAPLPSPPVNSRASPTMQPVPVVDLWLV